MENNFISLADYIAQKKIENPIKQFRSQRNELFNELYKFYEKSWRKNTWTNYIKWLKINKLENNKINREKFSKSKMFFPKDTEKKFCSFRLGFMPTKDLYYILSIAKDMDNRGENFNKWLFWAIKPQNK